MTVADIAPSATAPTTPSAPSRLRRGPSPAKGDPPRSHERLRVHRDLVQADLEVQMGAGRGAGLPDRRDVLARADVLPAAHDDAAGADVGVTRLDAVAVVDLDPVPVGAEPARVDDRAGVRRIDGAAVGHPDV